MSGILSYDAMVAQLVGMGWSREKSEAAAREANPEEAARHTAAVERKANVAEKAEQNAIRKMAVAVGCKVYWLSQARATKQTPGLPDLWITRASGGLAFWWETKRQSGGARSPAQEEFAEECARGLVNYGHGDRYHFADFLTAHGITPPAIPLD